MRAEAREHESLLDAFALREARVDADRPAVREQLLGLDTCLSRQWCRDVRYGHAITRTSYGPTSAASLTTRSSRLMISSHSWRSSTEIWGWTLSGSLSTVSTVQSWPCSETMALYAPLYV